MIRRLMHNMARKRLYKCDKLPLDFSPSVPIAPWKEEVINMPDNLMFVHGLLLPNDTSQPTILFFHGNVGNAFQWASYKTNMMRAIGTGCMVIDYPGYGKSPGIPCEESCYHSARSTLKWLVSHKGIPLNNIILYGYSLGGGIATQLAVEFQVAGLLLESTFTSVHEVVKEWIPWIPQHFLQGFDRYATLEKIPLVKCPILLIHGRKDKCIPFAHAERNLNAAPKGALLYPVEEAGHEKVGLIGGKPYLDTIINWLNSLEKMHSPTNFATEAEGK